MSYDRVGAFAAAILVSLGATAATAQSVTATSVDRNVGVLDRPRPDYDAVGMRSGAFILLPRLTTTIDFDDNIYATQTQKTSDTLVLLQPELTVRSDWSRNMIEGYARAAFDEYLSHGTENTEEYQLRGDGRYDIADDSNINGGGSFSRLMEPRYAAATTQGVRHPVRYDLGEFNMGAVQTFNRIRFVEDVHVADFRYENAEDALGDSVLEKDRDRTEVRESGRVEYAYSPDTAFFLAGELNQITYRLQPPASLFDRNADGYNLSLGTRLDLSHLVRGEFRVGYLDENYDSAAYRSTSGMSMNGKLDFFVTPLTTVTVTADRSVGAAADPRSSGYLTTSGGIEVDHELRRNVILSGQVNYATDDYKGIDRTDDRWTGRVGATYLVNRTVGVSLYYNYTDVSSSGVDRINGYKINQLMLALVLQR